MEKVTITPSMAEKLLEGNTNNRNVSDVQVSKYAKDMEAGNWQFNGETIKISTSGRLIDGQHRLLACIKAATPFETAYIDDLEEDVISSIDIGKKRSDGNILQIQGYKSANQVAAGARKLICVDRGVHPVWTFQKSKSRVAGIISTREILEYCEAHPYEISVIQEAANHKSLINSVGLGTAHIGFFYILFKRASTTDKALSFFQKLCDTERPFSTQADLLRKTLWESAAKRHVGERRGDYDAPILIIKAWNAYLSENKIKRLFVSEKDLENPPSILGVN